MASSGPAPAPTTLARDQYISRRQPDVAKDFACSSANISHYCSVVQGRHSSSWLLNDSRLPLGDLSLSSLLPATRYHLLRYEDLVSSPSTALRLLSTNSSTTLHDSLVSFCPSISRNVFTWAGLDWGVTLHQYVDLRPQNTQVVS